MCTVFYSFRYLYIILFHSSRSVDYYQIQLKQEKLHNRQHDVYMLHSYLVMITADDNNIFKIRHYNIMSGCLKRRKIKA